MVGMASYRARDTRHSTLNLQTPLLPFDRLRKRHTKQERGLTDVMMLIAVACQHEDYIFETMNREYLRMPMPPGSSIADKGKSMG